MFFYNSSPLACCIKSIYSDRNQVSCSLLTRDRGTVQGCHVQTSNILYILLSDLAQICSLSYQSSINSTKIWQVNKPKQPAAIFRHASVSVFRCDKKQPPHAAKMETRDWWHHFGLPGDSWNPFRACLSFFVSLFLSLFPLSPSSLLLFFPVCSPPSPRHTIRRASLCSR